MKKSTKRNVVEPMITKQVETTVEFPPVDYNLSVPDNDLELAAMLRAYKKHVEVLKRELDDRGRAKAPKAEYSYSVKVLDKDYNWEPLAAVTEVIRIVGTLTNADAKERHMQIYGCISGGWEETRLSVNYYRVNGVLLHSGGGWLILNDQLPCTDEEWEAIKACKFPEKFRR